MGDKDPQRSRDGEERRRYTQSLLNDINALEKMLTEGRIESDVCRIGAEQELVLVDRSWRPSFRAMEVLDRLDDPHFTTEIAKFNIEINLDPLVLSGDCLSRLEFMLNYYISKASSAAYEFDSEVVLIGILPTIRQNMLTLENMTPLPRYYELNEAYNRMREKHYELHIKGTDELSLTHDNVMLEASNTSFQVHFQVSPEEFADRYNIAQAAAAPVLAVAVNSPFLGRYRLWRETRIAVFQQSVDTRDGPLERYRHLSPRVHFGDQWIDHSVLEIFQEDIARHKVLVGRTDYQDPFKLLDEGLVPDLQALCLHNSTVYRWNRACYGISDGKPHLRIENRILPSGPTTTDEVANAAFWFGLMSGMFNENKNIKEQMDFDDVKENFFTAARHGLGAQIKWHGKHRSVTKIVQERLLPLAREGLQACKLDSADIERYLGVIRDRVRREQTGAQWMLSSFSQMKSTAPTWEKLNALTAATVARQKGGKPVHEWAPARLEEGGGWKLNYLRVEQYMTTDLFTVMPDEPIDLVAHLMVWKHIRHVLVEDEKHQLVGIVSHRKLLGLIGRPGLQGAGLEAPVSSIMVKELLTVSPETLTLEAIKLMREHRVSILPVLNDKGKLVGVVTEDNFLGIAANLLEQKLKE